MESSGWAPLVLIELVLIFGGVLAFAVWQLRSTERDMQRTREAKAREQARQPEAERPPAAEAARQRLDTEPGDER